MSRVVAYVRVSTGKQETENQRFEIERFCAERGFTDVEYVDEVVSGSTELHERKLGELLETLSRGDTLIVSEVSRISRRLFAVMSTLERCLKDGITILTVKEGYEFKDDISSQVMAFAFGLAADIERRMISARTKEALARKRAEGVKLGRPVGSRKDSNLKLHGKDDRIVRYLDKGVSVSAIARLLDVNRKTLRDYIDRRDLLRRLLLFRYDKTDV